MVYPSYYVFIVHPESQEFLRCLERGGGTSVVGDNASPNALASWLVAYGLCVLYCLFYQRVPLYKSSRLGLDILDTLVVLIDNRQHKS